MQTVKYCTNCGTALPEGGANYCSACGAMQLNAPSEFQKITSAPATSSPALIILCVLTILGSFWGIFKGLFWEALAFGGLTDGEFPTGYFSVLCNIGTLVGAILMLNRKMQGYIVYVVSQCANILTVIYWTTMGSNSLVPTMESLSSSFIVFTISLTVAPSLVFLALYTFMVRKDLR